MPSLRRLCTVTALVALIASLGRAYAEPVAPLEDIDTAAARRHYTTGRELYQAGRFEEACAEFGVARRILNVAALDFNLAKCEERLEHWSRAIELYEQYLSEVIAGEDTSEVVRRVQLLKGRVLALNTPRLEDPYKRRIRIAAETLAIGTVVLAAAGAGAYWSEWRAYQRERSTCTAMQCTPSHFIDTVHHAEYAGYALWAFAGAAAVADIALWVVDAKRRHRFARYASAGALTW